MGLNNLSRRYNVGGYGVRGSNTLLMSSQMCMIGLSSCDLDGQGSRLTSVDCSSNHSDSDTILERCHDSQERGLQWDVVDKQTGAHCRQEYPGKFDL